MNELTRLAAQNKVETLIYSYLPTTRNALVKDFDPNWGSAKIPAWNAKWMNRYRYHQANSFLERVRAGRHGGT